MEQSDPIAVNENGPMDLYGIGVEVFRALGGGEAYLNREREELRFLAEEHTGPGEYA